MKKAAKLLSAVLCASLIFTGCSKAEMREMMDSFTGEKADTELKKDVFSKKYKYEMTVPESWENLNHLFKGDLDNEVDILWAGDLKRGMAVEVTAGYSPYVGFEVFFKSYIDRLNSERSLSVKRSDFVEKDVNGYKAQYIELDDIKVSGDDNTKYKIWSYCIDDEKGIIIFQAIMYQEDANDEMQQMVESMIQTFRKY